MTTTPHTTAQPEEHSPHQPIPWHLVWTLYSLGILYTFLDYAQNGMNFSYERFSTLLIWGYIALFTIGLPLGAYLLCRVCRVFSPSLERILRLNLLLLTAYTCIRPFLGNSLSGTVSPILLCFIAVVITACIPFCLRFKFVREFFSLLRISILLVPAVLILGSDLAYLAFPRENYPAGQHAKQLQKHAPVILVVLDELPSLSLLSAPNTLDSEWLPALAEFSQHADFFPNTFSHSAATVQSLPSILSGMRPPTTSHQDITQCLHRPPVLSLMPTHLYQWFDPDRTLVHESHTRLCPNKRCEQSLYQSQPASLWTHINILFWHEYFPALLTPDFISWVKPTPEPDFSQPQWQHTTANQLNPKQISMKRDLDFIHTLDVQNTLTDLIVYHPLLPHNPFILTPEENISSHYSTLEAVAARPCDNPDIPSGETCFPDNLVHTARQRHLYQLKATDKVLGELFQKLKQSGHYDDALIIVTADHGIIFENEYPFRALTPKTTSSLALVPLWMKRPHQTIGHVYPEIRWLSDITPSILFELGAPKAAYQEMDGRPLQQRLSKSQRLRLDGICNQKLFSLYSPQTVLSERDKHIDVLNQTLLPTRQNPLRRLSQDKTQSQLLGRPASQVKFGTSKTPQLLSPRHWQHIPGKPVPMVVEGFFKHSPQKPPALAILINNHIEAIAVPFRISAQPKKNTGQWVFSAVVPESAFQKGENQIQVKPLK